MHCFEMLNSSEHEKLWRYSSYESTKLKLKKWSEVRSADPPISFYYTILRIGGPTLSYVYLNTISENGFGGNSFT